MDIRGRRVLMMLTSKVAIEALEGMPCVLTNSRDQFYRWDVYYFFMEDIKELLATTKKWLDIIYAPEESRRWWIGGLLQVDGFNLEPEKDLCSRHSERRTVYLHHLQPHFNSSIQNKQSRLHRCTYKSITIKGKPFTPRSTTTVSGADRCIPSYH